MTKIVAQNDSPPSSYPSLHIPNPPVGPLGGHVDTFLIHSRHGRDAGWRGSYDPIWPQCRDPTGRRRDRGPRLDAGLAQERADDGNDYQVQEIIQRESLLKSVTRWQ